MLKRTCSDAIVAANCLAGCKGSFSARGRTAISNAIPIARSARDILMKDGLSSMATGPALSRNDLTSSTVSPLLITAAFRSKSIGSNSISSRLTNSLYLYRNTVRSFFSSTVRQLDDYYEVLGVRRDATNQEIRKSYLQLVKTQHPDRNPSDLQASQRFSKINIAYETLRDPQQRKMHDQELLRKSGHPRRQSQDSLRTRTRMHRQRTQRRTAPGPRGFKGSFERSAANTDSDNIHFSFYRHWSQQMEREQRWRQRVHADEHGGNWPQHQQRRPLGSGQTFAHTVFGSFTGIVTLSVFIYGILYSLGIHG